MIPAADDEEPATGDNLINMQIYIPVKIDLIFSLLRLRDWAMSDQHGDLVSRNLT
jgi:hypothetical protein